MADGIGNAWHIPKNGEPSDQPSMRSPLRRPAGSNSPATRSSAGFAMLTGCIAMLTGCIAMDSQEGDAI